MNAAHLADLPIRPEYLSALEDTLEDLSRAGAWLDSEARVAIAEVTRSALADPEPLAPWEAPSRVPGKLEKLTRRSLLPLAADTAYRIARYPSTLTGHWYTQATSQDDRFTDAHYIELVTVVVRVAAADQFCHASGIEPFAFPEPGDGEPTRHRPALARIDRHWVPTLSPKDASEEYPWLYPGKGAPNVLRALSLVPEAYAELRDFQSSGYVAREFLLNPGANEDRPLNRAQIELVATSTSAQNECFY